MSKPENVTDFVVIEPRRIGTGFTVSVGGIEFSADSEDQGREWTICLLEEELAKLRRCPNEGCEFERGHMKDTPCGWRVKAAENSPAPFETSDGLTNPNEPTLACSAVVERLMLNKQTITHAKALESAQAFISEHFENPNGRKVRVSVPVQASDDDVLLTEYIRQREADSEWRERRVQELEQAVRLCMDVIWSEFHTGHTYLDGYLNYGGLEPHAARLAVATFPQSSSLVPEGAESADIGKLDPADKCKHEKMWFSRTIEADDRMHYFCEDCGKRDDEIAAGVEMGKVNRVEEKTDV